MYTSRAIRLRPLRVAMGSDVGSDVALRRCTFAQRAAASGIGVLAFERRKGRRTTRVAQLPRPWMYAPTNGVSPLS
jgi:hypothetical protein